jgi:hypothetical protein
MNPTLPQTVVDEALAEDLQAAKSEYLGEFRDDVAEFLPRAVIESLVVKNRRESLPDRNLSYFAFADVSGGRGDDAAFAVAHRDGGTVVLDFLKRYRPPFSPQEAVADMAKQAKRYRVRRVVGDNYAAEFTARAFDACGIRYEKCEKAKSDLYAELLPRLCSGEIELLDDDAMVNRLNCVPSNLLLISGRAFRTCARCGELQAVPASASNAGGYCRYCGKCRSRRPSPSARP